MSAAPRRLYIVCTREWGTRGNATGEKQEKGTMCIATWIWQSHPVYQLLLLLNRDEYHTRPTKPVEWWGEGDRKMILGGRDELAGGTWLGCTRDGRFAFLTNFREPGPLPVAKSRGDLPLRFLQNNQSPLDCAAEIAKEADEYNGFNLVLADVRAKTMVYISNRPKGEPVIRVVPPGLHVLSNANLDTPWPKAQRLSKNFDESVRRNGGEEIPLSQMVHELMEDTAKADWSMLPQTGCDPEWEYDLSSIFIDTDTKVGRYGTRSMAAISVKAQGEVDFYERYLENSLWKEHLTHYCIEKLQ
uniref:Transport and Golgi organization 2 homolog n=1 Tax=Ananas comosus var. bracteatus TaxID=296719 RepID=A0A6V7QNJ7_ANACO|nr:unnamed protein product [Ananas comosus var. bracteatus]